MNVDRLRHLADALDPDVESVPAPMEFEMSWMIEFDDDTPRWGCIAGFASLLFGVPATFETAGAALGLSFLDADFLFRPCPPESRLGKRLNKNLLPRWHEPFYTAVRAAEACRMTADGIRDPWQKIYNQLRETDRG